MLRKGEMIGKLGGDYLVGVRGQKRNELGQIWWGFWSGGGLDRISGDRGVSGMAGRNGGRPGWRDGVVGL